MTIRSINSPVTSHVQAHSDTLLINQSADNIAAELGGDPEAYLAAIVIKFADERGRSARQQRDQIEQHIGKVQAEQIDRLRQQADALRDGAVFGAMLTGLGGAASMAGGVAKLDGLAPGKVDVILGAGSVSEAGGTAVKGCYDRVATLRGADATGASNRADAAVRQLDLVKDDMDGARELEKDALDFFDQARETRAQTEQSVFIRG
jgi:hypothetical protein